jgi:hypothetical protein
MQGRRSLMVASTLVLRYRDASTLVPLWLYFSGAAAEGNFYEQVTEVKVCFYFFLHWVFAFVVVFGCDACCSPPGFYSHSR